MSSKRPLYDKVLVKADKATTMSSGGIYIPKDDANTKTGVITHVGQGIRLKDSSIRPLTVRVGDSVMIGKDTGLDIKVDGQDLLLLKESEVICILGDSHV